MATTAVPRPAARAPMLAHAGASAVLVLVLALVVSTAPRTSPPAIAEIAPQAVEQIAEAPKEHAVTLGPDGTVEGGEGEGGSGGEGGQSEAPKPDEVKPGDDEELPEQTAFAKCVGDPPRQTEDPQSPPCVPFWDTSKPNGGRTARGITPTTVRVAIPTYYESYLRDLIAHFNSRYTFYGRRLEAVPYTFTGGDPTNIEEYREGCTPQRQQQDALEIAAKDVFAVVMYYCNGGFDAYRRFAEKGVIAAESYLSGFTEKQMASLHPYLWQYGMAVDRQFALLGEWACARLDGRATHAGRNDAADLSQRNRSFGVIVHDYGVRADPTPLVQELEACGKKLALDPFVIDTSRPLSIENAIFQLKQENVTSVFCLCYWTGSQPTSREATKQGYYPEWLVATYQLQGTNFAYYSQQYGPPPDQAAHFMGITFTPRQVLAEDDPAYQALTEARPYPRPGAQLMSLIRAMYEGLLLVSSGVQMAGPDLTPDTFARALQRTAFPNPDHRLMAGKVGFPASTHSMTVDAAEWYWHPQAKTPYADAEPGSVCYIDGGARRRSASWPAGSFPPIAPAAQCDSGAR